jgi:hypothetical protein
MNANLAALESLRPIHTLVHCDQPKHLQMEESNVETSASATANESARAIVAEARLAESTAESIEEAAAITCAYA